VKKTDVGNRNLTGFLAYQNGPSKHLKTFKETLDLEDADGANVEKDGPAPGLFRGCSLLAEYLQQLRARQILPIHKCKGKLYVEHMCVRASQYSFLFFEARFRGK
jgi:hypothetical protein